MTRVERQSLWTAIARGLPPYEKATLHERLAGTELRHVVEPESVIVNEAFTLFHR